MRFLCAWCQAEGKETVLREDEGDDPTVISHGICEPHQQKMLGEIGKLDIGRKENPRKRRMRKRRR